MAHPHAHFRLDAQYITVVLLLKCIGLPIPLITLLEAFLLSVSGVMAIRSADFTGSIKPLIVVGITEYNRVEKQNTPHK